MTETTRNEFDYFIEVSVQGDEFEASEPYPKFGEVTKEAYEREKRAHPEMVECEQGGRKFLVSSKSAKWLKDDEGGYIIVKFLR